MSWGRWATPATRGPRRHISISASTNAVAARSTPTGSSRQVRRPANRPSPPARYHYGVRRTTRYLSLVVVLSAACSAPAPQDAETVAVVRSLGTFSGRGSQTIGVVSESGRLLVSCQTPHEQPPGTGTFRLALHSGVSSRPIDVITDQRVVVRGTREVTDDPRPYNLMVASQNLHWTFTV